TRTPALPPCVPSGQRQQPLLVSPASGSPFAATFLGDGGKSFAGFSAKNPCGFSRNPIYAVGITGKSSGRGICVWPKVYHNTTSVSSTGRSSSVHFPSPSPPWLWLG